MTLNFKIGKTRTFIKFDFGFAKVECEDEMRKKGYLIKFRMPEFFLYLVLTLILALKFI